MNTKILIASLLFVAIIGATIIALTPFGGFPDEEAHYEYARYLHSMHRLPPIGFDRSVFVTVEGFQPPFYYGLASLLVSKNQPASIIRIRCLSLSFALLTILFTFKSAVLVFGKDHEATGLATVIVATNAQFIFTLSGVTNISAMVGTSAIVFYLALRGLEPLASFYRNSVWMGISYGLAIMSRTITAFLFVPAVTSLVLRKKKPDAAALLAFCVPSFVVAGWWYIRNWIYYEDPLLWKLHATTVGSDWVMSEPLSLFYALKQSAFLHASFWAYFGRNEYHAGIYEYAIYLLFAVLAAIGFLQILFKKARRIELPRTAAILICLTAILGIAEILWMQSKLSIPQGRYFYISLAPIALILSSGTLNLFPEKYDARKAAFLIGSFLAAMSVYLLGIYYFPRIL